MKKLIALLLVIISSISIAKEALIAFDKQSGFHNTTFKRLTGICNASGDIITFTARGLKGGVAPTIITPYHTPTSPARPTKVLTTSPFTNYTWCSENGTFEVHVDTSNLKGYGGYSVNAIINEADGKPFVQDFIRLSRLEVQPNTYSITIDTLTDGTLPNITSQNAKAYLISGTCLNKFGGYPRYGDRIIIELNDGAIRFEENTSCGIDGQFSLTVDIREFGFRTVKVTATMGSVLNGRLISTVSSTGVALNDLWGLQRHD